MTTQESNLSYEAFSNLCEALRKSELVDIEECQYWLFELGYKAAKENKTKYGSHLASVQTKHGMSA